MDYGELKRRIAAQNRFDNRRYMDAKDGFVKSTLPEALTHAYVRNMVRLLKSTHTLAHTLVQCNGEFSGALHACPRHSTRRTTLNSKNTLRPLLILLLVTIVATTQPSSAIVPDKGPNASGDGQVTFIFGPQTGNTIDFSFRVKENKNGKAHGWARFDNLSAQTHVAVKMDCVNVTTFSATMSGTVQRSNDPAFPEGAHVAFSATDRHPVFGDRITPLIVISEFDCDIPVLGLHLLNFGDIRIEP